MDRIPDNTELSRSERVRQHAFYASPEGFRAMARAAGAAIIVDGGEATIGAGARPLVTKDSNPKLHRTYQNWLIDTGRNE